MRTLVVEESTVIHARIEVVSKQYGDVRHHAENHVHEGITFTILSDDGSRSRFRQEVSLLGMKQTDEIEQTRQADGSLLTDVVNGTNKGLRIRQSFAPAGADATRVTLRFEIPLPGMKRAIAPLLRIAFQRAIKKTFAEDRVDLEQRGYPRSGSRVG